jgi:hypothetical protein
MCNKNWTNYPRGKKMSIYMITLNGICLFFKMRQAGAQQQWSVIDVKKEQQNVSSRAVSRGRVNQSPYLSYPSISS